jgi:hypothetical protein
MTSCTCLDVLHSHLVTRIGNTGVPVLLFVQQCQFPFLVGQEDNLVIDTTVCAFGMLSTSRDKIHGHIGIIHLYIGVRAVSVEGSAAQSTSTRLYTLQRLSPIEIPFRRRALKLVIDTILSLKFMAK